MLSSCVQWNATDDCLVDRPIFVHIYNFISSFPHCIQMCEFLNFVWTSCNILLVSLSMHKLNKIIDMFISYLYHIHELHPLFKIILWKTVKKYSTLPNVKTNRLDLRRSSTVYNLLHNSAFRFSLFLEFSTLCQKVSKFQPYHC